VIAVDSNILLYSHRAEHEWYAKALACVRGLAEGEEPWLIPWPCVHEFLSVATNSRVFAKPTPMEHAAGQVDHWLASPSVRMGAEGGDHWRTLRHLLTRGRVTGGMVHDARIASICINHGVTTFWSADRDFLRFPELKTVNPLVVG